MSAFPTSSHRSRPLALASVALVLLSAPTTVVARGPDRVDLPTARHGEGITTDGPTLVTAGIPHVVTATAVPTTTAPVNGDRRALDAIVRSFATLATAYGITPGDVGASDGIDDHALSLPARPGASPSVTEGIPHIQQDQVSSPEMMDALAPWAFSLSSITELPSAASLPGARALTLSEDLAANEDAMIVGREFAHIHANPGAGSLHLRLPGSEASAVIDAGWGVWHPFALEGSMPGLIMVFAPRDLDDLEVIKLIVSASVEYAGG